MAPVAAIRVSASAGVSHVTLCVRSLDQPKYSAQKHSISYLVPALFTRGSATHFVEAAHGVRANLPPTHCPNCPPTHACSPAVHAELADRPANFLLSACASFPFCSVKAARAETSRLAAPVRPPVAPVAAIRDSASAWVSHVTLFVAGASQSKREIFSEREREREKGTYLVPALFTRGSATHCVEAAHGVRANLPLTHCPNFPPTHACSPAVHAESADRPANFLLSACASFPFCSVNAARAETSRLPAPVRPPVAPVAAIRACASAGVSHVTLYVSSKSPDQPNLIWGAGHIVRLPRSSFVYKGKRDALRRGSTWREGKLAIDALPQLSADARLLACRARRVR